MKSHGAIRYQFSVAFGPVVAMALRVTHPSFYAQIATAFEAALDDEKPSD